MNSAWGISGYAAWHKLCSAVFILLLVVSMSACSKTSTWKEEVLLHDGTTMIVTRSATRSGAGEIGQGPPITEHSIAFTPVGAKQAITWKSESTAYVKHANLDLLALDVVDGMPYIATRPKGCFAYAKFGRPNPPYVFFKYADQQWQQIPLQEFSLKIKQPNVVINLYRIVDVERTEKRSHLLSTVSIKEINSSLEQEELKTILRQPMVSSGKSASLVDCPRFSGPKAPSPIPSPDLAEPKKELP